MALEEPPGIHPLGFIYLLMSTSWIASSTDPRDKIYAIINLARPERYVPRPNYSIDWQQLYIDVAREALLDANGGYNLLESTLLEKGGLANNGVTYDLPSWVSVWHHYRSVELHRYDKWLAGGGESPKYSSEPVPEKEAKDPAITESSMSREGMLRTC